MSVTLGVPGRIMPPADKAIEFAQKAEADGYDAVWWPCHLMGWIPDSVWTEDMTGLAKYQANPHVHFEPLTMMGAAGAATERIRVGVNVTDTIRRHPAMLAQTALTVDHLARGRSILGLGSGERMNVTPYGIEWRKPVGRLEEAIKVMRLLWESDGPVDFDGDFFKLDGAVLGLEPYEGRTPPIWIGAHGPRMLDICGRLCDGWLPTNVTPEVYAEKLSVIRQSAETADRDPDAITTSMLAYVITAPDEETLERLCNQPLVRILFAAVDLSPETYARHGSTSPFEGGTGFHSFVPTKVSRAEAERVISHISPGIVREGTLHGTPQQITDQIRAYEEAGLRDVILWNITPFADPALSGYSFKAMREVKELLGGAVVAEPAGVKLLEPISVGSVELRNRVVSTAHGAFLSFYRPGESPDRYIGYQERRAAGGTGLIILQPVQVHASSQAAGHYPYEPDDLRGKLRAIKSALHAHGAAVFMQLMHFGAEFRSDASSDFTPLWSFGGTISASGNEVAHQMSGDEVQELVDAFVRTAVLALESGIDGVELHGAHGYLIQQSFSPWANNRDDEWGEPLRFVTAILERLRAQVGSDPVVGVRISVDDYRRPADGGLGPEGLREVARGIVDTGYVDYLNQSSGSRSSHYARAVGSYHHPPGELLPLIAKTREAIGARVPVVGVGRVTTPELAERALEEEVCDLVAMTRAQIADPDVVAKLRRGQADRIRPCVGANQGCVDRMAGGLPITCIHNPEVGREYELGLVPQAAAEPRRVLVVGAGPAGLAAARMAAVRGHRVTLVDRRSFLGGRLGLLADCGPASTLLESVRWLRDELERLAVKIELGVVVDTNALAERQPDVVVLATGARPAPDRLPAGDGSVPIVTVEGALTDGLGSSRVLVLDHIGAEEVPICAERLAAQGAAVTLATPMPTVGTYIGFTRISEQLKRLHGSGCELLTAVQFRDVREGEAVLRALHSGEERRVAVDAIVAGVPGRPELDLDAPAREVGARVLLAGDAVAPRDALRAFREGEDAGRAA